MIGFLLQVFRIFQAYGRGFRDRELQVLTGLVAALLISGTLFFMRVEGWRALDSAYFCVATLTTVGYGDFTPQTDLGKLFAILYMISGIGIAVAFLARLAHFSGLSQASEAARAKPLGSESKDEDANPPSP